MWPEARQRVAAASSPYANGVIVEIAIPVQLIINIEDLGPNLEIEPIIQQADRILDIELGGFASGGVIAPEIGDFIEQHLAIGAAIGIVQTQLCAVIDVLFNPTTKFETVIGDLPFEIEHQPGPITPDSR